MIKVELSDFEVYRPKLLNYASKLLRTRGFTERQGELKAFSEDVVQNAYIRFHNYGTQEGVFVSERHLENFLISVVYREYQQTIDVTRRGAQYVLLKQDINGDRFKNEFRQLDIKKSVSPVESEEFDVISSFKRELSTLNQSIVQYLLDGYNIKETASELKMAVSTVADHVTKIRQAYKAWSK